LFRQQEELKELLRGPLRERVLLRVRELLRVQVLPRGREKKRLLPRPLRHM